MAFFAFDVTESAMRSRTRETALGISVAAMSSLDLGDTIRIVIEGLAHVAGTGAGALFLLEDDQWVGKAGFGDGLEEAVPKLRFPYDELSGAVEAVENKEVLAINDARGEGPSQQNRFELLGARSSLVVPMVSGSRPVGAVYLMQKEEARGFSEEQLKFATIIGSHAALAVENSLIYSNEHAMRKSLEAIEVVSEAGLVSLNLEEVLVELVNRTQDVMQMDAAMILLYSEDEKCLVGRAATGTAALQAPVSQTKFQVGEGLAGRAFKEGAPLKIDDIRGHEEAMCPLEKCRTKDCPFSEKNGIVSVLAVPLRVAGKLMGVLQIGSQRKAAFSAREWGLIQVLADRASLAVQNSMLHENTTRELARLRLLHDIAAACAGSQDKKSIAERAVQAVYEHLGCSIASIFELDVETNVLINLASIGHPENVMQEYRVSHLDWGTLLTRAVNERRIITHKEVNLDNASDSEAQILEMLDIGYKRCARIPIVYQNEPVGAMALVFPDTRPFTAAGLETLKSISHLLAVAFKNSSARDEYLVLKSLDEV